MLCLVKDTLPISPDDPPEYTDCRTCGFIFHVDVATELATDICHHCLRYENLISIKKHKLMEELNYGSNKGLSI